MATTTAELTPRSDTTPAVAEVPAKEMSGAPWVQRFRGSASLSDLDPVFRQKAEKFIEAIEAAGGAVSIAATYRPRQRAYLMHYASKIARREIEPDKVPAMEGVNIEWVHETDEASRTAATAMTKAYGIVYPPALISRHTERAAVDMTITGIIGKTMKNASGEHVEIKKSADLHAVGASYGVNKLVSDPPHWSDNGR